MFEQRSILAWCVNFCMHCLSHSLRTTRRGILGRWAAYVFVLMSNFFLCLSMAVTGQTKWGASQAVTLDVQHLSGYGEYALAAIRVRPSNFAEGPDSRSGKPTFDASPPASHMNAFKTHTHIHTHTHFLLAMSMRS
jgi:hypothetical protein